VHHDYRVQSLHRGCRELLSLPCLAPTPSHCVFYFSLKFNMQPVTSVFQSQLCCNNNHGHLLFPNLTDGKAHPSLPKRKSNRSDHQSWSHCIACTLHPSPRPEGPITAATTFHSQILLDTTPSYLQLLVHTRDTVTNIVPTMSVSTHKSQADTLTQKETCCANVAHVTYTTAVKAAAAATPLAMQAKMTITHCDSCSVPAVDSC